MEIYNFPPQLKGDTFAPDPFEIIINGNPKNLSSTAIKIDFKRKKKTGDLAKTISDGAGITKVDSAAGVFKIDAFVADLSVGIYYYDIQFTDAGVVKTYISGTLEITQDVTD